MTETLAEKTCTPCRGGVPPLARDEALRFQSQAPDWELRDDDRRIERTFRFGSDIDYAMLVKIYEPSGEGEKRYSPARFSFSEPAGTPQ
jgi:4a-hydroxytetrahydrobiopterin dehydratase